MHGMYGVTKEVGNACDAHKLQSNYDCSNLKYEECPLQLEDHIPV